MSRIEDQANYYKNIPLRDRSIKAVIHIEDNDDYDFWDNQLQNVLSGKYHFISQSKSNSGTDSKGCEQCLRYKSYLSKEFFICIDSDLRLLRHEQGLTPENFIAQTYAYSWENHYCECHYLQQRWITKIKESDFNFVTFLTEFSKIVYKPLLFLVYHQTPELNGIWNITRFNKCIPTQPSLKELANNGVFYLHKIKKLFEEAIYLYSLQLPPDYFINGLTPKNAYLHIQGHQLYKLIRHIGTILCKGTGIKFTSEILNVSMHTHGYSEIDKVQSDLRIILDN